MLTVEQRSQFYWDHARVDGEMAHAYEIFPRSIFFNQEMAKQYKTHRNKNVTCFTNIVGHVDVYFQDDQLTCTRLSFPPATVPTYLPNNYELEQNNTQYIENVVYAETKEAEHEMLIIMNENQHNNLIHSTHSSFIQIGIIQIE